jgi:hypothetical protein
MFRRLCLLPSPGICVTNEDKFGIQYFGDIFCLRQELDRLDMSPSSEVYVVPHIKTNLVPKISEVLYASIIMTKK